MSHSGRTLLIVTGEASGDLHGAELARALWKHDRSLKILAVGGERMEKAGVRLIFDCRRLGVMGLVEVLRRWRVVAQAYWTVRDYLNQGRVDLVVLIDSPDFNLRVAAQARRKEIPVIYYIGPKVWAWRSGRLKVIARLIHRMLVIFPFEEELYQKAGVPCRFVGNPLLDELPADLDPMRLRRRYAMDLERPVVALLPGSRPQEVRRHLSVMLSAATEMAAEMPGIGYLLPLAPSIERETVATEVGRWPVEVKLIEGEAPGVLAASDAAIVASGTATLEAALVGTPMVIIYKMPYLTYLVARMMVKVRDAGLVNIVAGERVVPELLQGQATAKRIAQALMPFLQDDSLRQKTKLALARVSRQLGSPGASMRAAEEILKVLDSHDTRATAPLLS